jgi:hypothetical protein
MRVRVNFTIEVDLDDYRDKIGPEDITKEGLRTRLQTNAVDHLLYSLGDEGVKVNYLGQNNRYDPESRQTIHEEYVDA